MTKYVRALSIGLSLSATAFGGVASAKAPAGTPSTRTYFCLDAIARVDSLGEADFIDGEFLGLDNWIRVRSWNQGTRACGGGEEQIPVFVRTRDNSRCPIGFRCEFRPADTGA